METEFPLQFRPAISADIIRLIGMNHECNSDYVWQLNLDKTATGITASLREVRLPRSIQVQYPHDYLSLADVWKDGHMLVALHDGAPVGYVRFLEQATSESVWITDLVTAAEARRKGVALELARHVEDWAISRKNRQLFIEMSSKNHPAISLAKKLGFEFSGYNDHYYASQDVALFFGKLLKSF
jgi:ribosomal protein S18 acetylase RimI-like enzyme